MAGHSHWANISAKKGVVDKKRGKLFGKLSRAIIVAARVGGGDPVMNLRLRYAIDKAKAASMPKDTIERAIKKGTGDLEGESYEDVIYEGYGPGGVAVLCDLLTDNRNRTAGEIRKIFEVHGGNLGSTNCVAWMFERKGVFSIPAAQVSEDRLFEMALEAGADDVKQDGESFTVTCSTDAFTAVSEALGKAGITPDSADVARVPQSTVDLDIDDGRRMLELLEALEEQDDVQTVIANFNIPDELLAEVGEG
ncbi:MAG: YebC/PmpR family DNA-binding transcriptional regulator [Planctomycetota bacterium]|nr:YebC/PmpR family DNA-binding transcriptional regulator [Planctomycetaceae bacterium]MDQ3330795.1 YebC/PmpR family DNA-binding transcriptional regulator [Planctomycetota bacterium]